MKRIISLLVLIAMMFTMVSCSGAGGKNAQNTEYKIAMIADAVDLEDGSFASATWGSIEEFSNTNGVAAKCYTTEDSSKEAYTAAIDEAIANKAEIIIMAGSDFETVLFSTQSKYPDVKFLLIDGVPHDAGGNFGIAPNTIGVIFAEEEAGYLAGYAAVKDGYTKIAFMGGKSLPAVKRYGYGFVQGAAAAAAELEQKIELRYKYSGTFEESEEVTKLATEWYEDGTEVIFACGGAMGKSVMDAAKKANGKVIGADVDQSYMSNTVITSAQKNIEPVIADMLENYVEDRFVGGTAFNYTAKNDGIGLQIDNAKLKQFNEDEYKKVLRKLKNDKIQLKKDTSVDSVKDLMGEWITIK